MNELLKNPLWKMLSKSPKWKRIEIYAGGSEQIRWVDSLPEYQVSFHNLWKVSTSTTNPYNEIPLDWEGALRPFDFGKTNKD